MFALKSTHIFISNHKRKQLDISKLLISSCYCTYKGTEFLANHNWVDSTKPYRLNGNSKVWALLKGFGFRYGYGYKNICKHIV